MTVDLEDQIARKITPEFIREIAGLAKKLRKQHAVGFDELIVSYGRKRTVAERWIEAALLEAAGRHAEAAQALELITDQRWGDERALRLTGIARNYQLAGQADASWNPLALAARCAVSPRTFAAIDKLLGNGFPAKRRCKIGLVGSVTMDLWIPALRASCFSWRIDAQVYLGPFQQYHQEILDPGSGLAAFRPDIVVIAVDWRSLALPDECSTPDEIVREKVALFQDLWRRCRENLGANVIQHNFEVPEIDPIGNVGVSRTSLVQRINIALEDAAREHASVAVLDVEQTAAHFGKARWHDEALWQAARQYPAAEAVPSLMKREAALIRAAVGLTSKCLALDLDGTVWGGVIGEDGLAGIRLGGSAEGESFLYLQRYIQALQRRGIILAVCSKNNDEDARSPFVSHPEMVLKLSDIAVFVANWKTKDENLREIAATLNIGLDSIVFLDDNPLERNLIRNLVPEVEVPELPQDPANYTAALHRSFYFEPWSLTEDDRKRGAAYVQNRARREQQAASGNVDDYLATLGMQVALRPFDPANLARIVQLINKTNQFNLTTRRTTEAEIASLLDRSDCYTQFMRLQDRFGDNGITGILIAFAEGDSLRIHNWLISCRVLGRHVEDAMLCSAIQSAAARDLRYVTGEFIPTAKNAQVKDIYEKFGFELISETAEGNRTFRCGAFPNPVTVPPWLSVEDTTWEAQITYASIR